MPADYYTMGFQVDREAAKVLVSAISYAAPTESTLYAAALEAEEERKRKKAAKKAARRQQKEQHQHQQEQHLQVESDSASIHSFSSCVSLLRCKLSRKHRD